MLTGPSRATLKCGIIRGKHLERRFVSGQRPADNPREHRQRDPDVRTMVCDLLWKRTLPPMPDHLTGERTLWLTGVGYGTWTQLPPSVIDLVSEYHLTHRVQTLKRGALGLG